MRLICPNCGAQYEVADDVIPLDGRDVQCSNCGHTWFENRGDSNADDEFHDDPVDKSLQSAAPAAAPT
ncbi:MAG: zinc-ribbon domain-containing protein, partial [Yoonia sp.]